VTAHNPWPTFVFRDEVEVAKQVAAPDETRTPNLQRAKNSSMTGDGTMATVATRQKENLLTQTGLLMEGVITHPVKEDVKKKFFPLPSAEGGGACIQPLPASALFLEGFWVYALDRRVVQRRCQPQLLIPT